jgi:lysophospholipase L1-like esterase
MGVRDWEIVTLYVDSVGTSNKTVSFPKTQSLIRVTNKGNTNITYTIGTQTGTLTPGQNKSVAEKLTSFTIASVSGTQPFEVYATEDGTEKVEDASYGEISINGNLAVALGDSITAGNVDLPNNSFGDTSWFQQLIVRSKGKLQYVYNAGIPGNTTTQMLARIQTDVIEKKPKICFILGGTNDVATIPASITRLNIEQMIITLLNNKITPVLCTIPPRNDATLQTAVSKVNINIRSLAMKYGLHLIDFYSALVDPSNGYYKNGTTLSIDGIHPTAAGSKIMSGVVEQLLLPLFPSLSTQLAHNNVSGINLITNGLFLNDTNADGVPDGWIAYGGTASNVIHSIVTGDSNILGNWVQMQVNTSTTRILESTISTGFSPGDKIAVFGKIQATAEAGNLNYDAKINFTGGGSNNMKMLSGWTKDIDGTFYMEKTVPTGTTNIVLDIVVNSGTGTLKVAQCGIVNLTQLGL